MAVEFLHELDVPFFKVGSGDTNNFPYLEKTAKKGKHYLLSSICRITSYRGWREPQKVRESNCLIKHICYSRLHRKMTR